jgi:MprA protease rhombosortase-interaction domain-containing protein
MSSVRCLFAALAVGLAALSLASAPASATGLTGQSIGVVYYHPDLATVYSGASFTPASFVVGAGQETDGNIEDVTHLLVDFDDEVLNITLTTILHDPPWNQSSPTWNNTAFNGMVFTSVLPHDIATATVGGATTMAGFDNSRVSFTSNEILVNWAGLSYVDGTAVEIVFTFVPEPSSATLLLGAGCAAFALRRRS